MLDTYHKRSKHCHQQLQRHLSHQYTRRCCRAGYNLQFLRPCVSAQNVVKPLPLKKMSFQICRYMYTCHKLQHVPLFRPQGLFETTNHKWHRLVALDWYPGNMVWMLLNGRDEYKCFARFRVCNINGIVVERHILLIFTYMRT